MKSTRLFIVTLMTLLAMVTSLESFASTAEPMLDQSAFLMPQSISALQIHTHQISSPPPTSAGKLRIVSLNLAHGRKNAFSQILVRKKTIKKNLTEIANFLKKTNADIVALQEADLPSLWSGKFDHVAFIAKEANYPYRATAAHVDAFFGQYGTAILSRYPIVQATGVDFLPTPPTTSKGFTLARISIDKEHIPAVTGDVLNGRFIDIVSLHLDFSRQSVREQQLRQLTNVLGNYKMPKVIAGDFNAHWFNNDGLLDNFTASNKYRGYKVDSHADKLNTYSDTRIDWIFIDKHFSFQSYRSAKEILSDHRAVIADIILSPESTAKTSNLVSENKTAIVDKIDRMNLPHSNTGISSDTRQRHLNED